MNAFRAAALCLLAVPALWPMTPAAARPITPAERRFFPFTGRVAACSDPAVLQSIVERFQISEDHYWRSGLQLLGFDHIRETGYRTLGYDYVPRRYCEARAAFNDAKYRRIDYQIEESLGFSGYGFGVEYCIVGLDRNYAFGPNCRTMRP